MEESTLQYRNCKIINSLKHRRQYFLQDISRFSNETQKLNCAMEREDLLHFLAGFIDETKQLLMNAEEMLCKQENNSDKLHFESFQTTPPRTKYHMKDTESILQLEENQKQLFAEKKTSYDMIPNLNSNCEITPNSMLSVYQQIFIDSHLKQRPLHSSFQKLLVETTKIKDISNPQNYDKSDYAEEQNINDFDQIIAEEDQIYEDRRLNYCVLDMEQQNLEKEFQKAKSPQEEKSCKLERNNMFELNQEGWKVHNTTQFSSLLQESKYFSFDELVSIENTNQLGALSKKNNERKQQIQEIGKDTQGGVIKQDRSKQGAKTVNKQQSNYLEGNTNYCQSYKSDNNYTQLLVNPVMLSSTATTTASMSSLIHNQIQIQQKSSEILNSKNDQEEQQKQQFSTKNINIYNDYLLKSEIQNAFSSILSPKNTHQSILQTQCEKTMKEEKDVIFKEQDNEEVYLSDRGSFSESCDSQTSLDNSESNMNTTRGPYKKYSVKLKKKIVQLLEKGDSIKVLSTKYNIPIKNLQRWKVYGAERREGGGRKIMDQNMEVILLEFCLDFTLRGRSRCPRKVIMEKAREFTKEGSKFKGSKGWLDKYSTRTGLSKIMQEYKSLKVETEREIYKLVKLKSIEHIKSKIKGANPLCIFTSNQYIRYLEMRIEEVDKFWGITLEDYNIISKDFQSFQGSKCIGVSEENIFQRIVNFKSTEKLETYNYLAGIFGIQPEILQAILSQMKNDSLQC